MISAILFDLDGLLVDSTPLQLEAFRLFLEKHEVAHFAPKSGREGMRIIDILADYKDIYNLKGTLDDLYHERQAIYLDLARKELELFSGVFELLKTLKARQLKLALATSGDKEYVEVIFEKFSGLASFFDVVVTGEEVIKGKPQPDIFLKAAQKLAVDPTTCVVIEDSFNGILAAKAAQMQVICVPNKNYPEADYSLADKIFPDLIILNKALEQ